MMSNHLDEENDGVALQRGILKHGTFTYSWSTLYLQHMYCTKNILILPKTLWRTRWYMDVGCLILYLWKLFCKELHWNTVKLAERLLSNSRRKKWRCKKRISSVCYAPIHGVLCLVKIGSFGVSSCNGSIWANQTRACLHAINIPTHAIKLWVGYFATVDNCILYIYV